MEDKLKTTTEELDSEIERLIDSKDYSTAKALFFSAAKKGSFYACDYIAAAYNPDATVHPEAMNALFTKNKRKANHYYNRLLKFLRREAKLGIYPAMFHLYNMHNYGHPRLYAKNRLILAEYWLRKAAESGAPIPTSELKRFVNGQCS